MPIFLVDAVSMATSQSIATTADVGHSLTKLVSAIEDIWRHVESKKEEMEIICQENKKLFKPWSKQVGIKCEMKSHVVSADKKEASHASIVGADIVSTEQQAEIDLINQILEKADKAWKKHKVSSQNPQNYETVPEKPKCILENNKDDKDPTETRSTSESMSSRITKEVSKDETIGFISETALTQALTDVRVSNVKSASRMTRDKKNGAADKRMASDTKLNKGKQVSTSKDTTQPTATRGNKLPNGSKSHSVVVTSAKTDLPLNSLPKNRPENRTKATRCSDRKQEDQSISDTTGVNPTPESSKFSIPPTIKKLWNQNDSLRKKVTKLSQSSSGGESFMLQLDSQMQSTSLSPGLQMKLVTKKYDDLYRLLQSCDIDCISDISTAQDVVRAKTYVEHILTTMLELNKQTDKLLRKAQYSSKEDHNKPVQEGIEPRAACLPKSAVPVEFWLPPHLLDTFFQQTELPLKLSYSSLKELNLYWDLVHKLQQCLLSEHLLKLVCESLIPLLTSPNVEQREKIIIYRTLQGFLLHDGQHFPILINC